MIHVILLCVMYGHVHIHEIIQDIRVYSLFKCFAELSTL